MTRSHRTGAALADAESAPLAGDGAAPVPGRGDADAGPVGAAPRTAGADSIDDLCASASAHTPAAREAADPPGETIGLDIASLRAAYLDGTLTPTAVVDAVLARIGSDPHHAWIHRLHPAALYARAAALEALDPAALPLYGIPFAIKDNIDLAGEPTTAGCPAYAYVPEASAPVVQRLLEAGAIVIGKTNLDQFATGLNGTRSPYGACRNAFDPAYVSGGSSSGSAVAVALGQVAFALGTDTAGSGRVPAAFNQLVGLKPTRGLLSARGVVPACRSLDTISVFALTAEDAQRVFAVAAGEDRADAWSRPIEPHGWDFGRAPRPRIGVPRRAQLVLDAAYAPAWDQAVAHAERIGGRIVEIDLAPFLEAARLLYEGPWVAERYVAIRDFIERQPEALFPVTREITLGGRAPSAADAFAAQYRLRELAHRAAATWEGVDVVLTPTAPTHPTIEAMLAEPIARNSELGLYTNFMNLLDYAAIAVPAAFTDQGLPFGVTLFAPAHQDQPLLHLAARWQQALAGRAATLGATGRPLTTADEEAPTDSLHSAGAAGPRRASGLAAGAALAPAVPSGQTRVAVCGAHLAGQPLNGQLLARGAHLVSRTTTAPCYRFYALAGGPPRRPGLVRVGDGSGARIEVEVWELPTARFGSFVAGIPAPLGIGRTILDDGSEVPGFICEPAGLDGAVDITGYGGWRAYLRTVTSG